MFPINRPALLRGIIAGSLVAGALAAGTVTASAGECPAGKQSTATQASGPTKPEGVTDTVLGALDLAKDSNVPVTNRNFRLRKLVIQPGGIVPFHSHADRPALIYVVQGTILEHASTCAVPIVHKTGDVSRETKGVSHWWKNESKQPVILISADILHEKDDSHVM